MWSRFAFSPRGSNRPTSLPGPRRARSANLLAAPFAPIARRIESFGDGRQPRRRGRGGRAPAVSHGFVTAAGSDRAEAWTCGMRERASQLSISSRTRASLSSRRAIISPTTSAISCPAPDPPRWAVTPHDSTTRYPDDFTQVADSAKSAPRTGHKPRSDRLWLWPLCRRVLQARHSTCGSDRPC